MRTPQHFPRRERGAALIVGLILLLVMTVLAVATMGTANLEVVMASNTQNSQNAFQLAETGIDTNIATLDNNRNLRIAGTASKASTAICHSQSSQRTG